ncbi:MAG: DUF58 domain-containing protein [Aquabacterium sp.]|jgi:uncharacterized protein (DUF58 family)|nr:DUF58 domain-containing protein [Aquabacterium sp.]MBP8191820.1 DUF58 domain-containing protein [Aquabacterium sp.]MCC7544636.1 DUF58 domain-containing protein [Aquabacterium sp.]
MSPRGPQNRRSDQPGWAQPWHTWWRQWWEARLPRQDHLTLTQKNLYILPSKAGWSFGGVFTVLLLASINEQVNLGYALSFMLGGAALAALYQTHANLHGVSMRLLPVRSVHACDVLRVQVTLTNQHRKQGRLGLLITAGPRAPDGTREGPGCPQDVELAPGSESTVELDVEAPKRGWHVLPRITIETRYPLGLFRAWGYWRPQTQVLVWPALDPQAPPLPSPLGNQLADRTQERARHSEEMPEGLRDYRRGDPLRWIAWKKSSHALASGTGLVTREATSGRTPDLWLNWHTSPGLQGLSAEARLSRMATWLIQAEQKAQDQGQLYGLELPNQTIACDSGPRHLRQCLDTLALWGQA